MRFIVFGSDEWFYRVYDQITNGTLLIEHSWEVACKVADTLNQAPLAVEAAELEFSMSESVMSSDLVKLAGLAKLARYYAEQEQ